MKSKNYESFLKTATQVYLFNESKVRFIENIKFDTLKHKI